MGEISILLELSLQVTIVFSCTLTLESLVRFPFIPVLVGNKKQSR